MPRTSRHDRSDDADWNGSGERMRLLDDLATQALAQIAGRVRGGHADPDSSALDRLYSAAIGADPRACAEVARAMIANGLSAERICDVHVPATARRMGDDWVADDLPFSAVTIGTARLQGLLRELDAELEPSAGRQRGESGAILVVIAPGADHTLGALLLASQLRRRGFSVRLLLGEPSRAVGEAIAAARFDAVFLSATIAASVPYLAEAAAAIRAATSAPPPLVLGGALLGSEDRGAVDGLVSTVDHLTGDLDEAIRVCGLTAAG